MGSMCGGAGGRRELVGRGRILTFCPIKMRNHESVLSRGKIWTWPCYTELVKCTRGAYIISNWAYESGVQGLEDLREWACVTRLDGVPKRIWHKWSKE